MQVESDVASNIGVVGTTVNVGDGAALNGKFNITLDSCLVGTTEQVLNISHATGDSGGKVTNDGRQITTAIEFFNFFNITSCFRVINGDRHRTSDIALFITATEELSY